MTCGLSAAEPCWTGWQIVGRSPCGGPPDHRTGPAKPIMPGPPGEWQVCPVEGPPLGAAPLVAQNEDQPSG